MASQQDAVAAVEASGKVGLKASLLDLCKDGGAVDIEIGLLAAQAPEVIGAFIPMLAPVLKQVLQSVAAKLV